MLESILIVTVLAAAVGILPGKGKFWHRHHWYIAHRDLQPSMYSNKKENLYTLYKCKRECTAYKVSVYTQKKTQV